jgi:hypothetical protein
MVTRIAALAAAIVCVIDAAPSHAVIEVTGRESATIAWMPATGPAAGYYVYATFNGDSTALYDTVPSDENFVVLEASYGDAVSLQVAAFNNDGWTGPVSPISETIVFVPDQAPPPDEPPPGGDSIEMDFNGDALADILVHNADTGQMQIWMMNGTQITETTTLPNVFNSSWEVHATADLNGDRNADMVFRNEDGTIAMWINHRGRITESILYSGLGEWRIEATPDMNGDGKDDLLFRHTTGLLYAWFMDGISIDYSVALGMVPLDWNIAADADINGDGNDDLLWRHESGAMYTWMMDDEHVLSGQEVPAPGSEWQIVGMPDLDGDDAQEILWRHDSGMLYAWFMNGTVVAEHGGIEDPGLDWSIVGLRDFDGDGRDDFLWQHTSGLLYTWFMDGRLLEGGGNVGSPGHDFNVVPST